MRHMKTLLLSAILFALVRPAFAEMLQLAGETYPPYSYRDADGKPRGVYMDQIEIIMKKAGQDFEANIMPWARAIALAETTPMHCAYATARTRDREHKFRWVGPLHTDRNILVANERSGISIDNLEEARKYLVGTQRDDYTVEILRDKGFQRVDVSADFNSSLKKLISGRIDLMPMSESTFRKLYTSNTRFREVAVLSEQYLGMACNMSVPDKIIQSLQKELDAVIQDGTQRKIYLRHGLVIRDIAQ